MQEGTPGKTDVLIVGGGFAGLAAALRLQRAGAKVGLVEKRAFFGGRAYSFKEPKTGETLDNGQHLMMGCYHETLAFLRDLGTLDRLEIQKTLNVGFAEDARRVYELKCPNLPAPLHLAWGLLSYRGLAWPDKKAMLALMRLSKKARNGRAEELDELSVRELLARTGQTKDAVEKFWEPVALATLNESLDLASARLFVEVLRRGLLSKKSDSNLAIARVGLSQLYADPMRDFLERRGAPLAFNAQATRLSREGAGFLVETNTGARLSAQRLILAVPPNALAKLLAASEAEFQGLVPELSRFGSAPIVSINLWFEDFHPRQRMLGLVNSPIHWVFDKAKILTGEKSSHLTLVISGAHALAQESKDNLVKLAVAELQRFFPELEGKRLLHSQVVKELEATFSAQRGLNRYRPATRTRLPGLYLAGDWTDTGLPATIESAVLSGHRAAAEILESKNVR